MCRKKMDILCEIIQQPLQVWTLLATIISKHCVTGMWHVGFLQKFSEVPNGSSLRFFELALSAGPLMLPEKLRQLQLHT